MNMDGADAPKKPDTYRKRIFRRPTRRCIYIIVAVTVLCLILCIVLAVSLRPKAKDVCPKGIHCDWHSMPHSEFLKDERCDFLCTTRSCIRSAHYALSRIDSSKDPCEDFYEFACGKYEQEAILFPEDSEGVSTYQEMEDEMLLSLKEIIDSISEKPGKKGFSLLLVKKVYDDCMNTDHHPDVLTKDLWRRLFGENGMLPWPLLNENVMNDQKHFVRMMSFSLFYDVNPFFTFFAPREETVNNKTQWIFRFEKWNDFDILQSIHKESSTDDEGSLSSRYLFAFGKILTEVGVDVDELKNITTKVFEVEKEFLEAATNAVESNEKVFEKNRHLRYEYHNHSCQELDHRMGNIKWCKIAVQLRADYGLPANSNIRIELPSLGDYFGAVNTVLGHYLERDVINYIAVKFIMANLEFMPSPLREIYYREKDLFPRLHRQWTLSTRWQQCVEIVSDVLWLPLEKEYIRQKVDEEKRNMARHMVKKIKETYISAVGRMSWLKAAFPGSDPKKMIQEMKLVIGRLDILLFQDDAIMDNYYESGTSGTILQVAGKPLLEDILLLRKLNIKARLSPKKEIQILEGDQLFSIFRHKAAKDEIDIPYSMLSFSVALSGRPMFVGYATLGSFIFKYISQLLIFQITADNSTTQAYRNVINCLQEQSHLYKTGKIKYKVEKLGLAIHKGRWMIELSNALGTLGSFQAYVDYLEENGEEKGLPGLPFTNKQLFFLSNAQAHCEKFTEKGYADYPLVLLSPARFRVNIPLANSKAFSEAFRCPSGSSMNPKRKCCMLGDGMLSHECK